VGESIGDVVKLIGPDGVVDGFGVSLCLVVVVLRVVECDGLVALACGFESDQGPRASLGEGRGRKRV
jgi:hypothetical protein